MANYPLINGLEHDNSSTEIDVDGTIYLGIKELTYSDSREPGIGRGSGTAKKLFRTRGEYDAEGSIVMWRTQGRELIAALAAKGTAEGLGWMEVSFNITITEVSPGVPTLTTKLLGCNLVSREGGTTQGTDPNELSWDLDIMDIDDGGVRPVGGPI